MRKGKKPNLLESLIKGLQEINNDNSYRIKQDSSKRLQGPIRPQQGRYSNSRKNEGSKKCKYWNCSRKIKSSHFLCTEHYDDWEGDILSYDC